MAKKTAIKRNTRPAQDVQFIRTPGGDLAVMPRSLYDRLNQLAEEAREDAGTRRIVRESRKAVAEGREFIIPLVVGTRISEGWHPIKAFREWRGMPQGALAQAVGVAQGYLSEIEAGKKNGTPDLLKQISRVLQVPLDSLI